MKKDYKLKKMVSPLMVGLLVVAGFAHAQVPQSPSASYTIKNVTGDKTVAVDNPIKMTETYNQRVEDRQKVANAKNVVNINSTGTASSAKPMSVNLSQTSGKTPVVNVNVTPNASSTSAATPAKTETPKVVVIKESDLTEKLNTTSYNIKELGKVNSRLEYITQLQKLKQAEFDLLQPPEDKNAEKTKEKEVAPAAPTTPYNPVGNLTLPTQPRLEMVATNTSASTDFSNVNVYSIIGFDGKYSAKVSLDGQSTYTVGKGDTLPNGSIVTDVTRYYITVAEKSAVGRPLSEPQRIYATGKPLPNSVSLSSSSGSAAPSAVPAAPYSPVGGMIVPSRRP